MIMLYEVHGLDDVKYLTGSCELHPLGAGK
jgi:hypothetical protein